MFKHNVDGALFVDAHEAGLGTILRENKGEMVLAASIKECPMQNLKTIETLAILQLLQLCRHI